MLKLSTLTILLTSSLALVALLGLVHYSSNGSLRPQFFPSEPDLSQSATNVQSISQFIGQTFNILTFDPTVISHDPVYNIFNFTYLQNKNEMLSDGTPLPDNLLVLPIDGFTLTQSTSTIQTQSEYQSQMFMGLSISGTYPSISSLTGTLSAGYRNDLNQLQFEEQTFFLSQAKMQSYNLKINGDLSNMVLDSNFMTQLSRLPATYESASDLQAYQNFLNNFGTHFVDEILVGGILQQQVHTTQTYTQQTQASNINAQLSAAFSGLISASASFSQSTSTNSQQNNADMTSSVQISGGNNQWSDITSWIDSLSQYPGVVSYSLLEITQLFDQNFPQFQALTVSTSVLKQNFILALNNYFSTTGCMLMSASNYNPLAVQPGSEECNFQVYEGFVLTSNDPSLMPNGDNFLTNQNDCPQNAQQVTMGYLYGVDWNAVDPDDTSDCRDISEMESNLHQVQFTMCVNSSLSNMINFYQACTVLNTAKNNGNYGINNVITNGHSCPNGYTDYNIWQTVTNNYDNSGYSCSSIFKENYFNPVTCNWHMCVHPLLTQIASGFQTGSQSYNNQVTGSETCQSGYYGQELPSSYWLGQNDGSGGDSFSFYVCLQD